MTKQELKDFCVKNAGKMAFGKDRSTDAQRRGRIIAYAIDQFNKPLILLEDEKGKSNDKVPNPLPSIPYETHGWWRVISPAKTGTPVKADTVVLEDEIQAATHCSCGHGPASHQTYEIVKGTQGCTSCWACNPAPKASAQPTGDNRMCSHPQCGSWCHIAYITTGIYRG